MKDWYKKSIIYSIDVEAYMDGNGDGIGDFDGLRKSLPYLSSLGINCLWLLPFYQTPNRDNGYDVSDYFSVDPRLGDLGTFTDFMDAAKEHNIRVIIDLVVNHTSNEHPWFKEAIKGPGNKYYDYYIWADKKPSDYKPKIIFGNQQSGNWEYLEELDQFYYHTFYNFQPDLNLANPKVIEEIKRIMHFWLKMGVLGFRMDAVTFIITKKHESQPFQKDPNEILKGLRKFMDQIAPYAILLAEANVKPQDYEKFFAGKDEMHMLFNFYGNNYFFYSLATEKAKPLENAFKELPKIAGNEQYANFIRNHDELDLERLGDKERKEVFQKYASEEEMRLFGRGIGRRFQSMVQGERKQIELAYSLLLSLPGTPVIRYGEEIGMGDDLSLKGRMAVRTVMQWSDQKNGGFSKANPEDLVRPVIEKSPYGYKEINVNKQIKDKNSLLNWVSMGITARRRCPEFGAGTYDFLDSKDDEILIHICKMKETAAIAVHNFSSEKKHIKLEVEEELAHSLIDIFGDEAYPALEGQNKHIEINPKGYRWFRTGF